MPVSAADNALIDKEYYLAYLGDDSETAENLNEDHLQLFINSASQAIENHCDRLICPAQDWEDKEKFWGDGEPEYFVSHQKINSTPTLYYWNGSDWTEMTSSSYPREIDGDKGEFRLMEGYLFNKDVRYRMDYNTGWNEADVPAPIKEACCMLVNRAMKRAEGKEGIQSESFGDSTTSYDFHQFPELAIRALQRYCNVTGLVG